MNVTCQHCGQPTAANRACRHCGAPPGDKADKPRHEISLEMWTTLEKDAPLTMRRINKPAKRNFGWVPLWGMTCILTLFSPLFFAALVGIDQVISFPAWYWALSLGPTIITSIVLFGITIYEAIGSDRL